MRTISLRLPEPLLRESTLRARALGLPRAEYIRRAIDAMNRRVLDGERADRLAASSRRVRDESLAVLADFEAIDELLPLDLID